MPSKIVDTRAIKRLRIINIVLAFALVGVIATIALYALLPSGLYGSVEKDQGTRINNARAAVGAKTLKDIECLNSVAEKWSMRMANEFKKLIHSTDTGNAADSIKQTISASCGSGWTGGENISQYGGYEDALKASSATFSGYMDSPGHKANILNSKWTRMGVGAYVDASGTLWTTQLFAACVNCGGKWKVGTTWPADPGTAPAATGLGMAPGTSPSIWDNTVAFQANTGSLWTKTFGAAASNKGLGMMPGTSPSMYGNDFAFQANNTSLYRNGSYLGLGMASGTSPDVWGDRIAFQANTGNLYVNGNNQNLGMMGGTSPAIYDDKVVFQANTGTLWRKNLSTGKAADQGLGMTPGSSPDIWGDTVAFRASGTNTLWIKVLGGGARDTGLGIAPGTSPAIYDNKVVFQAYGLGTLWRYNISTGAAADLKLGMAPGTSPDIYGDRIVFQANTGTLWQYNLATNSGGPVN